MSISVRIAILFVVAGFTNSIPMNPANPQQFYQVVEP